MTKSAKPTNGSVTSGAVGTPAARPRDPVWLIRTYSGHSSAKASNELYRTNLARGQTGLSVAFDLPTQTGYDSDHQEARGEVGKVGVPICHLGDMAALFDGIPLGRMNTSMTINATAPWLLALYIAAAEKQGVARQDLAGTVQNDLIKEYLSRGTYIFPPKASLKLTADVIAFTYRDVPKWNPINICSYHLQEAGATPVQELAYTLATSIAVMDAVQASGQVPPEELPQVIGRLSFFVNAGLRFITEMCKMRAFGELWDELCRERWKVQDEKLRRFRYGVQVNSLGLTEQQPENNVYRVLLEMLAVTMSRDARARAVQLPAWNEALGLPRPWDQQWSIRLQQIVAEETDLLEYDDIFAGSPVIAAKVAELVGQAKEELAKIEALDGAVAAVESGFMKERLVESNARRIAAIESGDQTVVGVNKYRESAPSPLTSGSDAGFLAVDPQAEADQVARLQAWRTQREGSLVWDALSQLEAAVKEDRNIMPASIACAHAGVTTGEWAAALRQKFGAYRAPTGVSLIAAPAASNYLADVRDDVKRISTRIGAPLKILVGKPGLDGHSNGAEQVAVRARDCGFHVVYDGIRLTPAQIVEAAVKEGVHIIGLSILSGSHVVLVAEVIEKLHAAGLKDVPVVVGGIIPPEDEAQLKAAGVARVYTPKDFDLTQIMRDIVDVVDRANQAAA